MLERPEIDEAALIARLEQAFDVRAREIEFLPLGADMNTAVYRAVADDGTPFFVKLRGGRFYEPSVTLPVFLHDAGIEHIIAPRRTVAGGCSARLDPFVVIVYPFIEGQNGYAVALSAYAWRALGATLKRLHAASLPSWLAREIKRETYDPGARTRLRQILAQPDLGHDGDGAARELQAYLIDRRDEILALIARAERYARALQDQPPEFVVCHSDIHAGNVLTDGAELFYLIDWDDPIFAPKERDLMYIGGGQGFIGASPQEEERLFCEGYGSTVVNRAALAYYRYERIVQDLAIFCEQILLTSDGGADRPQALQYLKSNWAPGGTLERAYAADADIGCTMMM